MFPFGLKGKPGPMFRVHCDMGHMLGHTLMGFRGFSMGFHTDPMLSKGASLSYPKAGWQDIWSFRGYC